MRMHTPGRWDQSLLKQKKSKAKKKKNKLKKKKHTEETITLDTSDDKSIMVVSNSKGISLSISEVISSSKGTMISHETLLSAHDAEVLIKALNMALENQGSK